MGCCSSQLVSLEPKQVESYLKMLRLPSQLANNAAAAPVAIEQRIKTIR